MALTGEILRAFEIQAPACRTLGSPFTAHLCDRLAAILDSDTKLGRAVQQWPLDPVESALALRLCGALHMAVRAGRLPELARHYPPTSETGPSLDAALREVAAGNSEVLLPMLESAPQTNEVARSAVLLGGLLTIAARSGLPIELREIGSSAGLNLYPDRYAYELGAGRRWGPMDAPLTISCDWSADAPPLDAALLIDERAGVDLYPIDAADPAARERVLGYIWPDQPERLARTAAALEYVAAEPTTPAQGDAADWVESWLAQPPRKAVTRVLMHSITWQYFPREVQDRITRAMNVAGPSATDQTPLAWLRLEPDGISGSAAILLTSWPGGETHELGRGDYHGRCAVWNAV
jgi:hypothetical protein